MPSDKPKNPDPSGIELPGALTPAAQPVLGKKFTGGKKAVDAPPEEEEESSTEYADDAPVYYSRSSRHLLPVDEEPATVSPRLARLERQKKSLFARRLHAGLWMAPRRIARVHRRFPLPVVAGFYLVCVLVICLPIAGAIMSGHQAPVVHQIDPPVRKETDKLKDVSALIAKKDYDQALKELQGLLESQPGDPKVHVMHGALLAARRQYPEAKAAFQKSLDLSPGSITAMFNLAEIEFVLADYGDAAKLYAKLQPQMPDNKILLYRRYLCAVMLNDREEALRIVNSPLLPAESPEWFYINATECFHEGKKKEGRLLVDQARLLYGEKVRPHDQTLLRLGLISDDPW